MARLYEYQSKKLLREGGVRVPAGDVAFSPAEARAIAERIGRPVVLKIQVWLTGPGGPGRHPVRRDAPGSRGQGRAGCSG